MELQEANKKKDEMSQSLLMEKEALEFKLSMTVPQVRMRQRTALSESETAVNQSIIGCKNNVLCNFC